MRMQGYHGTTQTFETFDRLADQASGSITAQLGVFVSASPQIAAHFTLKPDVLDAGYDSHEGSRSLIRDPWRYDRQPFLPNAHVLDVAFDFNRPKHLDAIAWMTLVDGLQGVNGAQAQVERLREAWLEAGHDGLIIAAWDGESTDADGVVPSVEMDADTYVIFQPETVQILERRAAETCWPQAANRPRRMGPR